METDGSNVIIYTYGYNGTLLSFNYDNNNDSLIGKDYFYVKDLQGNIIKLIDSTGNVIVEYKHDAFGDIINKLIIVVKLIYLI